MNTTEIIAKHLETYETNIEEDLKEKCIMCGKDIDKGVKKNSVFSAKFTDYDECKNLKGKYVCLECTACVKERNLRTNNIIADKEHLYLLKKQDLEEYLFNLDKYVKDEFVVGITRSFKKHNSFRCKVNNDTKHFYIREEDKEYLFDLDKMKSLYKTLNEMYLYFTKDEMLSGQYSIMKINEFGLDNFNRCETVIKQYRKTHQLDLLIYMLDSEKRNKIVKERLDKAKEEEKERKRLKKEKEKLEKQNKKSGGSHGNS